MSKAPDPRANPRPGLRAGPGAEPRAGLRERKRQRTHDAVSSAAITLFLRHGYDRVSVADVAAAAEVSKPTLFRYFPSKEDLVLHRFADHDGEAARVVRGRGAGEAPLAVLHAHFLDGLARRDPVTGLNDHPEVLAFHGMVFSTPSLAARVAAYAARNEETLTQALTQAAGEAGAEADGLTARLAAASVIAAQRILARDNWRALTEGQSADERYPVAAADADRAFDLLASGFTGYAAPT